MRGGTQLTIGLVTATVLLELLVPASTLRCDRTPEGHVTPKLAADNRFQLKISGSPDKYVPGEGYTITLHGVKNHGQVAQKFTGFMLVVEPQSHLPLRVLNTRDVTPRPVGTFQLYGDTLTKFSPNCPNMVTHTSSMPKTEIQVRWTAPPPSSGCVIFRATVIEYRDVWYQDDGPLSRMLCEEIQESDDTQPDIIENCCACDEAKYEVTFEGLWSRHTHPKDFPSNSWLTRFSDVIGASHSMYYRFWEYGGFASEGLRQVAEKGSTRALESELKSQSQNIRTIIKARGISYPNVTGKTFAVFRVDKLHHLMSLVSMIDPSPDWVVGVSSLELCLANCSWVESKVLNLYPWDVGTDSGVTYISPDQQTYPRDKIRRITTSFPNDPRSPFYDPTGVEMKPLARLYLTRQRLYEKSCDEEPTVTNECAMSEWSDWTACSASCGNGFKHRQRHRLVRKSSQKCPSVRLSERKDCLVSHCRFSPQSTPEPDDPHCEVGEWGDWGRCLPRPNDHTCKYGAQQRYRRVKERGNSRQKYCLKYPSSDERSCTPSMSPAICPKHPRSRGKAVYKDPQGSTCCEEEETKDYGEENEVKEDEVNPNEGEENETENNETTDNEYPDGEGGEGEGDDYGTGDEPSGECAMTNWSEWSPCSVSCGSGLSRRFRHLLNPPVEEPRVEAQLASTMDDDYGTYDEEPAEGEGEQNEYAEGPCSLYRVQEVMGCNGTYPTCQFSSEDAREICALAPHAGRCPGPSVTRWYYDPSKEDCSEFQWSGCRGNKNRFLSRDECKSACQAYTAEAEEEENVTTEGEPNEEDRQDLEVLEQRREQSEGLVEGTERPVRNCKFSRWSKWSECEAPCNQRGVKIRTRYIEFHAKNGGKDCVGKTRRQKECFRKCKANGEGEDENEDEENEEEKEKRHKHGCRYSRWSEWTECTATCGLTAVRQRTRQVVAGNPFICADRIRKKNCNVGPCPGSLL